MNGAEAVWSCVEAVRAAATGDFGAGMTVEGALFARVRDVLMMALLAVSSESA